MHIDAATRRMEAPRPGTCIVRQHDTGVSYIACLAPALLVTPATVHLVSCHSQPIIVRADGGERVEVLAAMPELEVFHGVLIFRDPKRATIEENNERARYILSLCPRMR